MQEFGLEPQPLHITESCTIPASGGLGSSSTCVVAGIAAAQALAGLPLDRERTLSLATAIEGHPDNVAPAVMGGLVSSYVEGPTTVTTRWVVADNLRFVCMAPPTASSRATHGARFPRWCQRAPSPGRWDAALPW